jgi:hypothetical protein
MPSNALVATPKPTVWLVVVVAAVEVPVGTHTLPATLHVGEQGAQAVPVHTNALEPTPSPLPTSMMAMIVVVLAVKMPVRADADPLGTSPSAEDTQTV